jgi:hypothetical protein
MVNIILFDLKKDVACFVISRAEAWEIPGV